VPCTEPVHNVHQVKEQFILTLNAQTGIQTAIIKSLLLDSDSKLKSEINVQLQFLNCNIQWSNVHTLLINMSHSSFYKKYRCPSIYFP
jgi:hypothetical protein